MSAPAVDYFGLEDIELMNVWGLYYECICQFIRAPCLVPKGCRILVSQVKDEETRQAIIGGGALVLIMLTSE